MLNGELVKRTGHPREEGWLYYLDKKGDVRRARLLSAGPRMTSQLVKKTRIKRQPNWLYFIDKNGDVSRVRLVPA